MHDGGGYLHRLHRIDDRGQRCRVHLDQGPGILGLSQVLGHHNSDRLPDVAYLVTRQDRMDGRSQFLGFRLPPSRYGLDDPCELRRRENANHPWHVTGCCSSDRRDVGVREH
jgi:hypothetical protein